MTENESQSETQPSKEDVEATSTEPDSGESESAQPSLEEQLRQAEQERDEQTERALRAQAELDNVRKRLAREAEQLRQFAILPLVADLLPSLDNLKRAIEAAEKSGNVEELLQGIRMVSNAFSEVLVRHGVTKISTEGESFDPNLHEALGQYPSPDHASMTIIQEVESGWQLNDRVVRPSKVIVSSGPPVA